MRKKCGSHVTGNGLIGDRERDASSRENSPRDLPAAASKFTNEFCSEALNKFASLCAQTTAYSKGEKYAEKYGTAFGCGSFVDFRKFDAGACGEQPFPNSAFATCT